MWCTSTPPKPAESVPLRPEWQEYLTLSLPRTVGRFGRTVTCFSAASYGFFPGSPHFFHMPFVRGKTIRIYNGIDQHMSFGSGEIIRDAFPAGAKIIGTIGELNKNKNQKALIEQAKQNPNMYVAIVGEGEERDALNELIKKYGLETRVKLFGFVPAREALRGFDVFALPSLKEGLPYVLLEAKLAGLPIEASRVGGVGEILDNTNLQEFTLEHMVKQTASLYRS